ncbi:MAG: nucleotidyltransferase [Bryobacteraceae bacterium]|jgi:hypothetical protein
MPIPQSQLETWSHQGAVATSSAAYNSIRQALLKATSPLASRGVDIFLQGSYANSTNIYADSDVDVVVLYGSTFYKDLSALTPAQQQFHEALFPPAAYLWTHLRDDTLNALRSHYGNNSVTLGRKSIKVQTGCGRRPSDVVPAVQFRRYATFVDRNNLTAHWGIQLFDVSNNPIVNYPKYHIERGENKNQASRTGGQYKATVRIFKNLRNYLIDTHQLADRAAPSYFLECTLHNIPDHLFAGSFRDTVPAILSYLASNATGGFLCQNGVVPLFGNGPTQWSEAALRAFVQAAKTVWDTWYT